MGLGIMHFAKLAFWVRSGSIEVTQGHMSNSMGSLGVFKHLLHY